MNIVGIRNPLLRRLNLVWMLGVLPVWVPLIAIIQAIVAVWSVVRQLGGVPEEVRAVWRGHR